MPDGWTDPLADLSSLSDEAAATTPAAPAAPATPAPTATTPGKEPPAPAKPALPGEPPEPEKFEVKFVKARELREEYERQKAEFTKTQAELTEARDQLKEAGQHKTPELLERIQSLEKEREQYAKELAFVNYERSPEYKEKYTKPITAAFSNAYADVQEMTVSDPRSGEERAATPEDFNHLVRLPIKEATKLAQEWFGPLAQTVLTHRAEVNRLDRGRIAALEDYKKNSVQYETDRAAKRAAQSESNNAFWDSANKDIAEKFPAYFKPDENDPQSGELLQKGFQLFDAAISPGSPLTPEQRMRTLAAMRHKAAAFDRLALQLNAKSKKIADLENELAQYQSSEPSGEVAKPAQGGSLGPIAPKTWEEELSAMAE